MAKDKTPEQEQNQDQEEAKKVLPVIGRFRVNEVALWSFGEKIKLSAIPANEDSSIDGIAEPFFENTLEASPEGELEMTITNKALAGNFTPGQEFYVELTPIETE